jgi:hypothetical protein
VWRFVLDGSTVECYRNGRKILSYVDVQPASGNIALTASQCDIEVLAVRYLALPQPSAQPTSAPATKLPLAMRK